MKPPIARKQKTWSAFPGTGRDCKRCSRHLTLNSFWRDSQSPDGLERRCADCATAYQNGLDTEYAYADTPLKRASYKEVEIHGRTYMKYVVE